ncbi:hypothetical protein UFOVP865_9 [uncultured Caudovirales phage]|uniref:Uncharacterized protein n=1 Tax=uncultured Caudovirales phage TaxID=2100421 RepID=A0A6J5PCM4_9CAUD|nr:hypothetical protein UFOVP865_9 [uncultured Caudovirales phage]
MATTTNYSWSTPDDTALVKDGAAAIRTLGSSVDTTTKALNPSTTLGDIEYRSSTANTNTRLGIGTTGQVLTVAAGVPSWATPASGGMTLLHTLTLNSTSTTQSSINQSYKNLYIVGRNIGVDSNYAVLRVRFGGITTGYLGSKLTNGTAAAMADGGFDSATNDLGDTNGSSFHFTCFDYADTTSEKLIIGQSAGNSTGNVIFYSGSPWELQSNISTLTITTVAGTKTMSGTVEIYGVR